MTRKQTLTIFFLTIAFFAIGEIGYESLYRLTFYTVKALSSVPLSFYGKYPFWFGDTRFSLIIASIPLTVFFISKILGHEKNALVVSLVTYSLCFVCSYLFVCFWTSLSFHSLNDFYHGEEIKKNIRDVNINETFLSTLILAAVLTFILFLLTKILKWLRRKIH